MDHIKALNKAKIALMSSPNSAFFTTLCFNLKIVWDDSDPTAYTDGTVIGINPGYFMELKPEERVSLLLHETLHVAYLHMTRQGSRDHRKFNHAADYVINLQLLLRNFPIPNNWLLDHQYAGMSTEQVYDLLPDTLPLPPMSDLREPEGKLAHLEERVQDILVQAVMQSKMSGDAPGTIPGEIEIFVNNLLEPKLPWNRILQKFMSTLTKDDYSWKRPNRRFFPQHILPSLHSEKMMSIAVAVDTSGSVSDADFKQFISEVHSILRRMKPEKITVIQFDTSLKSVNDVKDVRDLQKLKFTGRGGTSIAPVIEWANQHKPRLLLVFSDGYFHFYDNQTAVQTLWLVHNNPGFSPPFGKTIHYTQ